MPVDDAHVDRLPILDELGADLRRAMVARDLPDERPSRRHGARSRGIVIFAACLLMSATALAATRPWSTLDDAVQHGQRPTAPNRHLPWLDGTGVSSLRAYRGRIVVLSFWASWCGPCQQQVDNLETAGRGLRRDGAGLAVLVSFKDDPRAARSFVRRRHLSLPVLEDRGGRLAGAFGTVTLPQTFVIDGRGRIVAISRMPATPQFLRHAITVAAHDTGTLLAVGQPAR